MRHAGRVKTTHTRDACSIGAALGMQINGKTLAIEAELASHDVRARQHTKCCSPVGIDRKGERRDTCVALWSAHERGKAKRTRGEDMTPPGQFSRDNRRGIVRATA